jgi:hypothetical protein
MIDVCICNTSNLQIEPCTTKWKQLEMEAARMMTIDFLQR